MGLTRDKVMINIEKYGNTTAATIPLCLWEWRASLKKEIKSYLRHLVEVLPGEAFS